MEDFFSIYFDKILVVMDLRYFYKMVEFVEIKECNSRPEDYEMNKRQAVVVGEMYEPKLDDIENKQASTGGVGGHAQLDMEALLSQVLQV